MLGYGEYGFGGRGGGYGFNAWTWIILILIVLQWFRVDGIDGIGVAPGIAELGLMANGGLIIIAIFLLVAWAALKAYTNKKLEISSIRNT